MAYSNIMAYYLLVMSHSTVLGVQFSSDTLRVNKFHKFLLSKNISNPRIDITQARKMKATLIEFPSQEQCIQTMCAYLPARSQQGYNTQSENIRDRWGPKASLQHKHESNFEKISSTLSSSHARNGIVKRALRPQYPEKQFTSFQTVSEMQAVLGFGSKLIYDGKGQVIGVEAADDFTFPNKPGQQKPDKSSSGSSTITYSACCSTREMFFMNRTMIDYHGKRRTIAQLNHIGSFQFIRHGMCGNKGACQGECRQMDVTMPLVVHPSNSNSDVTFGFFKVPGYCVCRIKSTKASSLYKGFIKFGGHKNNLLIH